MKTPPRVVKPRRVPADWLARWCLRNPHATDEEYEYYVQTWSLCDGLGRLFRYVGMWASR